jgi:hypothetical protein
MVWYPSDSDIALRNKRPILKRRRQNPIFVRKDDRGRKLSRARGGLAANDPGERVAVSAIEISSETSTVSVGTYT